jgi:transcriptional regulator GlxA family with amidase domain
MQPAVAGMQGAVSPAERVIPDTVRALVGANYEKDRLMNRRDLLQLQGAVGLVALLPHQAFSEQQGQVGNADAASSNAVIPLKPPASGQINVAFLLSAGAVVIDFAGPWEVFGNVHLAGSETHQPFRLYTVAESTAPIQCSGGMTIVPNYSLATAPAPKVLVIPAQAEPSHVVLDWVRLVTRTTDVTMSVCTGAFLLAQTGLLSGKAVTTHHSAYSELAMAFPDVSVKRGARFVEAGNVASSGGLSSGIDLALHVVERYFGRSVAATTADNLEYQGLGWTNADSNQAYAKRRVSTDQHPLCPVCEMDVDSATSPKSVYRNRTYYFCMDAHKQLFERAPERFV